MHGLLTALRYTPTHVLLCHPFPNRVTLWALKERERVKGGGTHIPYISQPIQ
jgi:hypothetical protein